MNLIIGGISVLLLLIAFEVQAAHTDEWLLQGTVVGFSPTEVLVKNEDGKEIVVPRAALDHLELKPGLIIRVSMPLTDLDAVRAPRKRLKPQAPPKNAPSNEFVPMRD